MSNAPLPGPVDARKLSAKGAEISAQIRVSELPRIADMLASDRGNVAADLRFFTDEDHRKRLDGHLAAQLEVVCQRCLEAMPLELESDFALGIVWSEEEAKHLGSSLEPLIVGEELVNLADVISEELILSLPYVSYHRAEDCSQQQREFSGGDVIAPAEEERENPFKVLEQLKQHD